MVEQRTFLQLSQQLKSILWQAVANDEAVHGLVNRAEAIDFHSPAYGARGEHNAISLWLWNVERDAIPPHLRELPVLDPAGNLARSAVPRSLVLKYLITPLVEDEDGTAQLLLLDTILAAMQSKGVFENPVSGGRVSVEVMPLALAELTQLWLALGQPMRPSVILKVRTEATPADVPAIRP